MKKKILSLILALSVAVGMLGAMPLTGFAEAEGDEEDYMVNVLTEWYPHEEKDDGEQGKYIEVYTEETITIPNKRKDDRNITRLGGDTSDIAICPNVKKIIIPDTIKEFVYFWSPCFTQSFPKLEEIYADSDYFVSVDGVLYSRDMTKLIAYPCQKKGESYTVPNSVKSIQSGAFSGNNYLKHIYLPEYMEEIGFEAFANMNNLEEIEIPEGVTELITFVDNNENLKHITVPYTLNHMSYIPLVADCMMWTLPNLEDIRIRQDNEYFKNDDGILLYKEGSEATGPASAPIFTPIIGGIIPAKHALTAVPTNAKLRIDGKEVKCEGYNILGNNYFKLRDIAYLLNGTPVQFKVFWNEAEKIIEIENGEYEPVGGECVLGDGTNKIAYRSLVRWINKWWNGRWFNINGNNYFAIRDIAYGISYSEGTPKCTVEWDEANNTIDILTSEK